MCVRVANIRKAAMESTHENLPDRLRWFHENGKINPAVLMAAPLFEAADEIEQLRKLVIELRACLNYTIETIT